MEPGYPVGWFVTTAAFLRFKVVPCLPRRIMKQLWVVLIHGFSEHLIASMRIYASIFALSMQSRQINSHTQRLAILMALEATDHTSSLRFRCIFTELVVVVALLGH